MDQREEGAEVGCGPRERGRVHLVSKELRKLGSLAAGRELLSPRGEQAQAARRVHRIPSPDKGDREPAQAQFRDYPAASPKREGEKSWK